jgi:AraC-like DNA-binding protein
MTYHELMASTTLTSWALLIWKALEADGCDHRRLFTESGLDPSLLGDGNARYEVQKMQALWQKAVVATNNPAFGLEVGKLWGATSFHALGFAWLASSSLSDALERSVRYSHIVSEALTTKIIKTGAYYEFHLLSNTSYSPHYASIDATLASIVVMCRQLCGDAFAPVSVEVFQKATPSSVPLEAFIRCPISYHTISITQQNPTQKNKSLEKVICIRMDAHSVEATLASGNSALAEACEGLALNYLNQVSKDAIATQVIARLVEQLPSGKPDEQKIADALHLSTRTLQRKLAEQDTSFKKLLTETRQDMAKTYLGNSHLSLTEITYLLGYSEQANFTRAFRRWEDTSPSEYRKNLLKEPA